jgi:CHAT domain-containing protein
MTKNPASVFAYLLGIILCSCLLFPHPVAAQNHLDFARKADSLSGLSKYQLALEFRKKALESVVANDKVYPILEAGIHLELFNLFISETKEASAFAEAERAVKILSGNLQSRDAALMLLKVGKTHYEYLYYQSRYDESIQVAAGILALANKSVLMPYDKAELLANIAHLHSYKDEFAIGIKYYEEAIGFMLEHPSPDLNSMALYYNQLGFCYDQCGFIRQSFDNYAKAFDIWYKHFKDEYEYVSTGLHNLISSYHSYGDEAGVAKYLKIYEGFYRHCLEQEQISNRALEVLFSKLVFDRMMYFTMKNDSVRSLKELQRLEYMHKEPLNEAKESIANYLVNSYEMLGLMFRYQHSYQKALAYFDKIPNLQLGPSWEMKYHANTAITHYKKGDFEQALLHIDKCLTYFQPPFVGSSYYSVQVLKAELLQAKDQHQQALELIARFIGEYLGEPRSIGQLKNLRYDTFMGLNSDRWITILNKCGDICRNAAVDLKSPDLNETALVFYQIASEMFRQYYLKGDYNPSLDQLHRQSTKGVFEVFTSQQLTAAETFAGYLALIENNASRQIWKKFLSNNEQYLSSDVQIIREKNLLLMQKNELTESEAISQNTDLLQAQLNAIEKQLEEKKSLSVSENASINISALQKTLNADESVLKYYLIDSSAYVLSLSKDGLSLQKLMDVDTLQALTADFLAAVHVLKSDYKTLSKALFKALLPVDWKVNTQKLIIIPDGFLWKIPFESLMTESGSFLVENYAVRYAYDLMQLTLQLPKPESKKRNFLAAFAPDYSSTNYAGIYNNVQEAQYISTRTRGDLFTEAAADKSNFIQHFTNYRLHHLAMHAEQDPDKFERSALIFANGEKLFFHELYQFNLPSDLVVLSACNTGVGSLKPGEGIMSLSRALTYAGVRSSVNSLWPVPDKETAEIMVAFYDYLKQGLRKDDALASAKRDFLALNPLKSHPYYWAGFVLNGEPDSIFEAERNGLLYWLLIPIFTAMFYFGRKKWKSSVAA